MRYTAARRTLKVKRGLLVQEALYNLSYDHRAALWRTTLYCDQLRCLAAKLAPWGYPGVYTPGHATESLLPPPAAASCREESEANGKDVKQDADGDADMKPVDGSDGVDAAPAGSARLKRTEPASASAAKAPASAVAGQNGANKRLGPQLHASEAMLRGAAQLRGAYWAGDVPALALAAFSRRDDAVPTGL